MIQDVADTLEMFRKELNHGPHFLVRSKPSEERLLLIPFQPRSKRAYDDEQERNSPDDEVDDDWLPPMLALALFITNSSKHRNRQGFDFRQLDLSCSRADFSN